MEGPKKQPGPYSGGQPQENNILGNASTVLPWLNPFTAPWMLGDKLLNQGKGGAWFTEQANNVGEMFGLGGPPKPGDYAAAAKADADRQNAANRPTQTTPFGSTKWTQDANGNWVQSNELSGDLGTAANDLMARIRSAGPLDLSGLPELDYGAESRQKAYDNAYTESARQLDPAFRDRDSSLRTQLLNQGLDPNSQAGRAAMSQLGAEREGAYAGARSQALNQGQQAQQQAFGQSLASRGQKMAELIRGRQSYFDDLGALRGLMEQPGFQGAVSEQQLRSMGMRDEAELRRWMAQQQATADMFEGAGQAGSAILSLLPLSDARVKREIRRLKEELLPGVRLATWEYLALPGRRWLGVIAQDLARVAPRLVFEGRDGILRVPIIPIEVSHA